MLYLRFKFEFGKFSFFNDTSHLRFKMSHITSQL